MATKFDFKKSPDVNGTADKTTLYPKIVVAGTKNLENIADDIAKRSGFKAGTVIGLFSDLENLLTDYLADGYNVKLGEIGTFSATLTSRKVTDKKEIRSGSVHSTVSSSSRHATLSKRYAERAKWNWNAQTLHTASRHLLPSTLRKSDSAC